MPVLMNVRAAQSVRTEQHHRGTRVGLAVLLLVATVRGEMGAAELGKLPANRWTLLHDEDPAGGKTFARAIWADGVERLYLWGTGGRKPARNVYARYELEAFDPKEPAWLPAFPAAVRHSWTAGRFPPFRIYGQSGPDGLRWDEGPRLQVVGGYHSVNRIRWWDFDGIRRPSPIHTFNMACRDSKRGRIIYYSDGVTLALDPATNSWTDLEAKNYPSTCRAVAWASLSYDAGNDRVMLHGGGLATHPSGGAPTWFYDCTANEWRRPGLAVEPPLRCNAPIVYDPSSESMVLFGGYDQAAALNDTWVLDCRRTEWQRRTPKRSPPPMEAPATALLGGGKILVCGNDARKVKREHMASTSAQKETWVYDVAANTWTPLDGGLRLPGYRWLTASRSGQPNVALLVAFGPRRRTHALRYDPEVPSAELPGAPAGTIAWKYPEQKRSLEEAPPPRPVEHAKLLAGLTPNTFVDARPPGLLISKTWSTAVIDTNRSEVLYTGGGHSGYSGNDFARYSIRDNRWSLDQPPRFPPFLEGTNAGIFGWSYGRMPFSQHTYLWYAYDPSSRRVVYLARPSIPDGIDVQIDADPASVFTYDSKTHGHASWVYDPEARKMHRPVFGRPFKNPWHLSLVGTPRGVFAAAENRLYHAAVDRRGHIEWSLVDARFPAPREPIKYHYEYQPLVHDTKRDRLLQLKGDSRRVDVFARPLAKDAEWHQVETEGSAAIGREAVYIERHDVVLWLGSKLYALDCATQRLDEVDVDLPEGLHGHECAMVYDGAHDVCVALIPSRFSGPLQTFLFRFDPPAAKR